MKTTAAISQSHQQYQLLIHSLTHEHTKTNFDRHVLLFEKWFRDFADGFYVCDLEYVNQVVQILKLRVTQTYDIFRPLVSKLLKICGRPLLEIKANERLRVKGMTDIKSFYLEVATFWAESSDTTLNFEVGHCFRCIVRGGQDPSILRADSIKWNGEGVKMQITDAAFIQGLMRENRTLEYFVNEFIDSVYVYTVELEGYRQTMMTLSDHNRTGMHVSSVEYGAKDEEDDSDGENDVVRPSTASPPKETSSSEHEAKKRAVASAEKVAQVMLDLCMDVATDPLSAADMCILRVCDAAVRLIRIAAGDNLRDKRVVDSIELMWTVLEAFSDQAKQSAKQLDDDPKDHDNMFIAIRAMDYAEGFFIMKDILVRLFVEGYKKSDKECRNELVAVLTLLAQFPEAFPFFIQTGLITDLMTYSCVAEAGPRAWTFYTKPLASLRNFALASDIDLELKRALWLLVSDLMQTDDSDALLCLSSSPMLTAMLRYIEVDTFGDGNPNAAGELSRYRENDSSTLQTRDNFDNESKGSPPYSARSDDSNGNKRPSTSDACKMFRPTNLDAEFVGSEDYFASIAPTQMKQLQILAMTFLAKNATRVMGEYLRIGGPDRIIEATFRYCRSPQPEHKSVVYYSLLVLNRTLLGSNVVRKLMEDGNAISAFLYLVETSDDELTRTEAARLIAVLCNNSNLNCQAQLRDNGGIPLLVHAIATDAEPRKPIAGMKAGVKMPEKYATEVEDPSLHPLAGEISVFIVAVLDCVAKSIVGNKKNEMSFAREEGLDALLNLLECSPYVLRSQVLRLLSDILENLKLVSFMHAWRSGKTLRSAAQLLAHCWLDEEVRLNGVRKGGIICDIWDPLGNHDWPGDTMQKLASDASSASIASTVLDSVGGGGTSARSLAVSRLATAILESRVGTSVSSGTSVPVQIRNQVLERDTRGIVASILQLLGVFDEASPLEKLSPTSPDKTASTGASPISKTSQSRGGVSAAPRDDDEASEKSYFEAILQAKPNDMGLTQSDRQVVAISRRYAVLREGSWWTEVSESLEREGLTPIEADHTMIQAHLEAFFDASQAVQLEQMALQNEETSEKKVDEDAFIDKILLKKSQQIKMEWLKKNSKNKTATHPHTKKVF